MTSDQPANCMATELPSPIRVLVADDSPVARELMVHLLTSDPRMLVVGVASDGIAAVSAAAELRPDVITMDIHMPRLDGFAASRTIMETCPTRIIMVTASLDPMDVAATFHTLEAGALTVIAKPGGPGEPHFEAAVEEFVRTVKVMSTVPVVKRWPRARAMATGLHTADGTAQAEGSARDRAIHLVAIGASTGGPMALRALLSRIPRAFPVPILIVQHIADGFAEGFTEWLAGASGYPVKLGRDGDDVAPGTAYVAPSGLHMTVTSSRTLELVSGPAEGGLRPSVAQLFRSANAAFGAAAVGVLLTGMGRDGALELLAMRRSGAVTIAQDRESSVVYGMPAEAIKLDAARYVLSPEEIAGVLCDLFGLAPAPRPVV
ncbi:chemotaxis-specific protein-glutamate methyltransferase CheB [Trinickia fusca]|nr:chemotaxis-specific protein-glutamate methyltransferase CheB [Trinickia fusca]